MPNLVLNLLTITPSTGVTIEDYQKLRASIFNENNEPDMNVLIPIPEEFEGESGRQSRNESWGTSWNFNDFNYNICECLENKQIAIKFVSAWSPPNFWLKKLISIHSSFEYELLYSDSSNFIGYIFEIPKNNIQEYKEITLTSNILKEIFGYYSGLNTLPPYLVAYRKILDIDKNGFSSDSALAEYESLFHTYSEEQATNSWLKKLVHQIKSFWRGR